MRWLRHRHGGRRFCVVLGRAEFRARHGDANDLDSGGWRSDRRGERDLFRQLECHRTNASLVDSQALGTITDNDTSTISIGDITAIEGDGGTAAAVFTVSLSVPSSRTVTVDYATGTNGTARRGVDYQAASGGLTFVPGATSQTFTILVNGDIADKKMKCFHVESCESIRGHDRQ